MDHARFHVLMSRFDLPPQAPLAVAVSGGADSMALLSLLHVYAQKNNHPLTALTVDHRLRAESAQEAAGVAAWCAARGIAHLTLAWEDDDKPQKGLQQAARDARYRLMAQACHARGIGVLALAHHAQDQAETFWMRLSHGSGPEGLRGMQPESLRAGLRLIRPLLGVAREDLRDHCQSEGIDWAQDPTNENKRYLRPRLRAFEETLAQEGLGAARLAGVMQKLADAQDALAHYTDALCAQALAAHPQGYVTLVAAPFAAAPLDIRRRVLARALQIMSPQAYAPDHHQLTRLAQEMARPQAQGQTLQGCLVYPRRDTIVLCREAAVAAPPAALTDNMLWDGRFLIRGLSHPRWRLGALGEVGHEVLGKTEVAATMPHKIRLTLPAVWEDENLLCVPHLSWCLPEKRAALAAGSLHFAGHVNSFVKIV